MVTKNPKIPKKTPKNFIVYNVMLINIIIYNYLHHKMKMVTNGNKW